MKMLFSNTAMVQDDQRGGMDPELKLEPESSLEPIDGQTGGGIRSSMRAMGARLSWSKKINLRFFKGDVALKRPSNKSFVAATEADLAVLTVPRKHANNATSKDESTTFHIIPTLQQSLSTFGDFDSLRCVMVYPGDVGARVGDNGESDVNFNVLIKYGEANCPTFTIKEFADKPQRSMTFAIQGKRQSVLASNKYAIDVTDGAMSYLLVAYPLYATHLDADMKWLIWTRLPQAVPENQTYWKGYLPVNGRPPLNFFCKQEVPSTLYPMYQVLDSGSMEVSTVIPQTLLKGGGDWKQTAVQKDVKLYGICFRNSQSTTVRFFDVDGTLTATEGQAIGMTTPTEAEIENSESVKREAIEDARKALPDLVTFAPDPDAQTQGEDQFVQQPAPPPTDDSVLNEKPNELNPEAGDVVTEVPGVQEPGVQTNVNPEQIATNELPDQLPSGPEEGDSVPGDTVPAAEPAPSRAQLGGSRARRYYAV